MELTLLHSIYRSLTRHLRGSYQGRFVTLAGVIVFAMLAAAPVTAQQKAKPKKRTVAARTLDAINIEGEIAVPQVLFITARDFRRYRDGTGAKFRMTKLEVARSVDLPTRLRIVAQSKEEGQ